MRRGLAPSPAAFSTAGPLPVAALAQLRAPTAGSKRLKIQRGNHAPMSQSLASNTVMLPSDFERQQIFYWLQKVSSVTAWHRVLEFYKEWAEAAENSVREADANGWGELTSLSQSSYARILKGLAHCEEAVIRLGKGDKRVFKFDANGEFEMASRSLYHWREMITRVDEGENGIDEEHTPLWPELRERPLVTALSWIPHGVCFGATTVTATE